MNKKGISALLAAITLFGTTSVFAAETTIKDTGHDDVDVKIISPNTSPTKTSTKPVLTSDKDKGPKLPAGVFKDTKDHWAKSDIQAMANAGYVSGYADGSFKPNDSITREQAAAIYNKILMATDSQDEQATMAANADKQSFSDVDSDRWSSKAIKTVAGEGIMTGRTATSFAPTKVLTREEFAVSAARFAVHQHIHNDNADAKVAFKDADKITPANRKYVDQLAQEGFIASGVTVQFRPADPITRAEATSILYRMVTNNPIDVSKGTIKTKPKTGVNTSSNASTMATEKQVALEDKVFAQLNKTYKSPANFQKYGVMYWKNDILHVAIKNNKDLNTVKANLADLGTQVVVEPTKYSQAEYDVIDKNFRASYKANEPKATIFATFPDVPNNRLYAVVSALSKTTQTAINGAFGDKVTMAVK